MRKLAFAAAFLLGTTTMAFAADTYNPVPSSDAAMLQQCITYATNKYTGGDAASLIPGQNKSMAFCTCMWNETPDDFKGNLAKFADTAAGAKTNATCEKYSGWQ
jgi:hypothetical protein